VESLTEPAAVEQSASPIGPEAAVRPASRFNPEVPGHDASAATPTLAELPEDPDVNVVPQAVQASGAAPAALDWSGLAYRLGLVGLAQEIVANSLLESCREGKLKLGLLPEIHELANSQIESEIRQALEQKLEVSLQLELIARDTLRGETPLQAKLRRLEQERLAAIEAIREDAAVCKLQQVFAAELDEQSVVKIDNT